MKAGKSITNIRRMFSGRLIAFGMSFPKTSI
jgi:hypothetical protein